VNTVNVLLAFTTPKFHQHVVSACSGTRVLDDPGDLPATSIAMPRMTIEVFDQQDLDRSPSELARELSVLAPDVISVGPNVSIEDSLALIRELDRQYPEISVVLIEAPTAHLWRAALHAGARDVIDPEDSPEAISSGLRRAAARTVERRGALRSSYKAPQPPDPKGRIVTIISPKGGSGKTVVATNLAVSLAKALPGEVVLVDLDLQFGDVASSLGLKPVYSMYTATQASGSEASLLKAFLTPHDSQLLVLCAPEEPTEADDVKEGDAIRIVHELSKLFRWVIVDTSAGLDDMTLAAAEASSDLLFVSSTDVPSVRGIRKEALIMDQLGVRAKRHFVLNRSDAKVGLSPADIALTLGMSIAAQVPSSRSVPTSVNVGVPIVEHESRNPAARGLAALATTLLEQSADASSPSAKGFRKYLR
jgi:pilus assembly protein CpaE